MYTVVFIKAQIKLLFYKLKIQLYKMNQILYLFYDKDFVMLVYNILKIFDLKFQDKIPLE